MVDERISVLQFSNCLMRGGAEEHILTLLRGLDRSRFEVHLVCTPEVATKIRADVPADVDVVPLCLRGPRDIGAARLLARTLRERRVDILHSHLFYASLFASPIGKLCRIPVVVETPHVREQWRQGLKSSYTVDRLLGRCVDHYIAVSEANRKYLIEHKGLPADKIVMIHNGSDLRRFTPEHQAPPDLRRTLGIDADDPVLLVLARLEPQKGHRVLFRALPAIRQKFATVRVVCVGEGALRAELEDLVKASGLTSAVRFVGQQANVQDWLALADLTVLPSFFEGLPLVAIESLAAGRPMVATAVDGTPEIVRDGETGFTVPPGDPGPLADAICRLLGDGSLRQRFARAGRELVVGQFDETRQVQQTERFYELAMARRTRPAPAAPPVAAAGDRR